MQFLRSLVVLALVAASAAAQLLPGGPYVTLVTPRSAIVMWVTEQKPVRYGTTSEGLSATAAASPFRVNQVQLTDLQPGTTYHYDVPDAGAGSFTTPPNGHGDFTFVVYGDSRTRPDVHRKVALKIFAVSPAFVVHTGDQVADGRNASHWPTFFDVTREMLRSTVFFPALGNHERNTPFWYQFFGRNTGYYSFDWGAAHFVILNSDVNNVAPTPEAREAYWKEQIAWMEKDLEAARSADFRFVAFHHPPYTAMKRRWADAEKIAARLVPLFRKHHVHAVFGGHDHNYQRHVDAGIQYVVTGGGGAPLYDVDGPLPGKTVKAESVENYVIARVEGKVVRFEARTPDDRVLDKFEIKAGELSVVRGQ